MLFAIIFLFLHWYTSLFFQSFYLHRYKSHGMVEVSKKWDWILCVLTALTQGPSFLRPALYRSLHISHHAHSDLERDPHSPKYSKNIFSMMNKTLKEYLNRTNEIEDFPNTVRFFDSIITRFLFIIFYIVLYLTFTNSYFFLLLVPIHSLMGPIHGAIVNWFGHKNGYRNFNTNDDSRNTFIVDFLMMGELYQNNHHANPNSLKFATKKHEIDFTYWILRLFGFKNT